MTDAPEKPDPTSMPKLTVTDTGIAPYVYFEGAPNFGFVNGIISITLAANRHLLRDGAPVTDAVTSAPIKRCLSGRSDRSPQESINESPEVLRHHLHVWRCQ